MGDTAKLRGGGGNMSASAITTALRPKKNRPYGISAEHAKKEEAKDQQVLSELGDRTYAKTLKQLDDIIANSEFGTYRSVRSVIDIVDSHFKSQVETGESSGAKDPTGRRINEGKWFGTDVTSPAESFAKYGMLVSKDLEKAMVHHPFYGSGYGKEQALITFKPESVYGRATLTTLDSLDYKSSGFIPSTITKDGLSSLSGIAHDWGSSRAGFATTLSKYVRQGVKDGTDYYSREMSDKYLEVQYHGKYTAKDIKSIVLRKSHSTLPKATVQKVEKYGGVVYRMENGKLVRYYGD